MQAIVLRFFFAAQELTVLVLVFGRFSATLGPATIGDSDAGLFALLFGLGTGQADKRGSTLWCFYKSLSIVRRAVTSDDLSG
jgi:hypothetical protein